MRNVILKNFNSHDHWPWLWPQRYWPWPRRELTLGLGLGLEENWPLALALASKTTGLGLEHAVLEPIPAIWTRDHSTCGLVVTWSCLPARHRCPPTPWRKWTTVQSVNSYIGLLRLLVAYDADDSALNITESGNGVHVPIHKYRTGSNKPCNISSGGKVTCFQQFFCILRCIYSV